jgi:transcriptional antiterminator NusG
MEIESVNEQAETTPETQPTETSSVVETPVENASVVQTDARIGVEDVETAAETSARTSSEETAQTDADLVAQEAETTNDEVATNTDGVAEAAPVAEEEEFIIPKGRRKTAKKSVAEKKPRKMAKKKIELPDLGDGSGYAPPDEAEAAEGEQGQWYAIHCYSGQENKVKHNLEQRTETMGMAGKIFKVIVPTEDEIEVRDGKRRTVKRQVFPGYVLVNMHMSEESWFVVRNTPGVTRFVGMGNRPQPLGPNEVNVLLGRMEAEAPKIKVNFRTGQKVRIIDGPFSDFIGVVDKIDTERAKVTALVSFFGRETPVELDFLQVEKT